MSAADPALLSFAAVPDPGRIPVCLSIAGSDSGGGAGIQADLKAFARAGVHGTTAITAITAQNTVAVTAVEPVSAEMIVAQVAAVVDDIGVDAVKVGMLGSVASARAVGAAFDLWPRARRSSSTRDGGGVGRAAARGGRAGGAGRARRRPGHGGDAQPARGASARRRPDARGGGARARRACARPAGRGRHGRASPAGDRRRLRRRADVELAGPRYPDGAAHGSGCTHSSTLAARLALGDDLEAAAREAKRVASEAVRDGLRDIGAGAGPVDVLGLARQR